MKYIVVLSITTIDNNVSTDNTMPLDAKQLKVFVETVTGLHCYKNHKIIRVSSK